jgi:hypothetical protein
MPVGLNAALVDVVRHVKAQLSRRHIRLRALHILCIFTIFLIRIQGTVQATGVPCRVG